jgi:2-phospho-L-lactate transferase/gluconeogenesis factor (CofD/UPF0052 family)
MKVYVCNVATQPGETDALSASEHLEALFEHVGPEIADYVLINRNARARPPQNWQGQLVEVDDRRLETLPAVIVEEDLIDETNAHRHDPGKLAATLMRLLQEDQVDRPRQRRVRRQSTRAS